LGEGEELWKKYCSFFDKPFSEQVEYSEGQAKEWFKKWNQTKMAKQLRYKKVKRLEDIPPTDYSDYLILREFGAKMQKLSETVPRKEGELLHNYYDRIGKMASPMLDGWIMDKYSFCVKTSGVSGESKWFAHGDTFWKNASTNSIAVAVLLCSDKRGDTKLRKGDKILHMFAPPPYGTSYVVKSWEPIFKCLPPTHIVENITEMRKKLNMVLKIIEKEGEEIAFLASLPSVTCLIADYLTAPEKLFKDRYQSMNFGLVKFVLFLKYLQAKLGGSKHEKIKEILHVKGMVTGGDDARLYVGKIKDQFGEEPLNIYGTSEGIAVMVGTPERKIDLVPILRSSYFEFLTEEGNVKKVDELKKGNVYEVMITPFGSTLIRYKMGDLFRVIDFMDDGMPIFCFEGRKHAVINMYGYYRISQSIVLNALKKAGLKATDNWTVTRITDPTDRLLFLMEKEWEYSEEQAARLLFNSLQEIHEDFRNYVKDFKIQNPFEALRVEYLRKGAFMRYVMRRAKEGVPFGQMKPQKIISDETSEAVAVLRRV